MRFFALLILFGSLWAKDLPVFLRADSVETEKIIRNTGKDRIPAQFVQKLEFTYAETVVALDSICEQGKCYPTDFETVRVAVGVGETARVALGSDTVVVVGRKDNLKTLSVPQIDPAPDSSGDEFLFRGARTENYCDTVFDAAGKVECTFCGVRQVIEYFSTETTSTAVLVKLRREEIYPPSDSCRCGSRLPQSGVRITIKDRGKPVGRVDISGSLDLPGLTGQLIPQYRVSSDVPLIGIHYYPPDKVELPQVDTIIEPILAIDGSWVVRFKYLYAMARDYDTYEGYISYVDELPWGQIDFTDVGPLDFAVAAPAQYVPTYSGETLGYVSQIISLLEEDGIADDSLYLCYPFDGGAVWRWHKLRDIFYKNFDAANSDCPIVFSRPVDTLFSGVGNLGDNSLKFRFARAEEVCDGIEGMIATDDRWDEQFFADALYFSTTFDLRRLYYRGVIDIPPSELEEYEPKLVVYVIGAGSVPRLWLNGTEYIISPEYFPSYGDPYGFVYSGYKTVIDNPNLIYDGANEIEIEHISPQTEMIGTQVILALKFARPEESVERIRFVGPGDGIMVNKPIYRSMKIAPPGRIEDTIKVPNVGEESAVIVLFRDNNVWKPCEFSLQDSLIIAHFPDTLTDSTAWRWWFFSGDDH